MGKNHLYQNDFLLSMHVVNCYPKYSFGLFFINMGSKVTFLFRYGKPRILDIEDAGKKAKQYF